MNGFKQALLDDQDEFIRLMGGMPLCASCVHYIDAGTCKAFPAGIPSTITVGAFDHHNPYPGDGGIQFKEKK